MKIALLFICALALCCGCGEHGNGSSPSNTNSAAGATNAAANNEPSGGYLGAIGRGQQNALKTIDTTQIKQAIQLFNVDKGRNPKDLNELVTEKYIPQIPPAPYGTKLDYDASSGTVKVVKQ